MTVILPAVPEVVTNRYSKMRNQGRGNDSNVCYCSVVLLTLLQDQLPKWLQLLYQQKAVASMISAAGLWNCLY